MPYISPRTQYLFFIGLLAVGILVATPLITTGHPCLALLTGFPPTLVAISLARTLGRPQ